MVIADTGGTARSVVRGILLGAVLLSGVLEPGLCAAEKYRQHDELFSASFIDEREGWACGDWGTIVHTRDGGQTWESQESGTEATLSAIVFVDSENGWAVGRNGTIVHTVNGGEEWASQESPVPFFHRDVFFVNPSNGWIVSESTHILYTDDGGDSWGVQFEDEIYNLAAISFSDERHGWAVGEYGFTYYTEDGGNNWQHKAGYFRISDETGDIDTGVTLFDVVALDDRSALAVGADGVVTTSDDGGDTWNLRDASRTAVPFFGAAFDGGTAIVIGGQGAYLYSPDRGLSWKELAMDPPMDYRWLYGFAAAGLRSFVGVGEEGAIYLGEVPGPFLRVDYSRDLRQLKEQP